MTDEDGPDLPFHPDGRYAISLRDWNAYCEEKGIGSKPCPACGRPGQVGATPEHDPEHVIMRSTHLSALRGQSLTQECNNCGHQVTFGINRLLDWMGLK